MFFLSILFQLHAINPVLAVADSLYKNESYNQAITEYKRYVFLENKKDINSDVYVTISKCYRKLSQPDLSLKYIDAAIFNAETDSLRSIRRVDKAIILMSMQKYSLAEFILVREIQFSRYPEITNKANLTLSLDYALQSKWTEAENAIKQYADKDNTVNPEDIKSVVNCLEEVQSRPLKDPVKAKRLSTFFPGAGQFYCGDIANGTNALALDSALLGWAVYSVFTREVLNVYPILFLFWKYYQGNRYRAELICKQYNTNLQSDNIKRITEKMSVLWNTN